MIDWSRATRAEVDLVRVALVTLETAVTRIEKRTKSASTLNAAQVQRFEIERMRAQIDAR